MRFRTPALLGLCCLALAVGTMSCDMLDGTPDEYMVRQVTYKAYSYLDFVHRVNGGNMALGATIMDVKAPPGMDPLTCSMKITAYETNDSQGYSYTADAVMDNYTGDGTAPYMELSGNVTYTDNTLAGHTRALKGTLTVTNGPDANCIDKITFDLIFPDEVHATGTVVADGKTLTLDNVYIPVE